MRPNDIQPEKRIFMKCTFVVSDMQYTVLAVRIVPIAVCSQYTVLAVRIVPIAVCSQYTALTVRIVPIALCSQSRTCKPDMKALSRNSCVRPL